MRRLSKISDWKLLNKKIIISNSSDANDTKILNKKIKKIDIGKI